MKKIKKMTVSLMSAIILLTPVLPATAKANEGKQVVLGGQPFGVKFYNNGVIVVELEEFYDGENYVCPSKESGLKVNDIIKKANGTEISSNDALRSVIDGNHGEKVSFEIERDGKILNKSVTPKKNTAGNYLMGAWVKDSCAGIGTVTYYDKEDNSFAALGHGICDNDTSALLPLGSAEIVEAKISSITKSSTGKPGSLNGYFSSETIGNLTKNTDIGVFGEMNSNYIDSTKTVTVSENNRVETGEAEIYTTLDNGIARYYKCEITKICNSDKNSNENFVIKVTDKELLEKCGGIVQGMSGSPIVQNGKLVGALTHVFINKPEEGYGVLIQNMVSNTSS